MSSTSSNNVPYHIVTENITEHTTVFTEPHSTSSSHVLAYVLIPVGSVILVALLALIVSTSHCYIHHFHKSYKNKRMLWQKNKQQQHGKVMN